MTHALGWALFALAAIGLAAAMRRAARAFDAERRLRRQNRYYAFLTRVTATIFREKDPEQILASFCDAAVREGGFALAWAGRVDPEAGRVNVIAAAGDAAGYARAITVTTDPALPTSQGPTGLAIAQRRTMAVNDFLGDPRTAAWREHGRTFGLRASASVPVVIDKDVVAALSFYSETEGYFDEEMVHLLEETAHNVALALEARTAAAQRDEERRQRAEAERRSEEALRDSERRFRGLVEQTIAGFYVVRDNITVYVNPRLVEMTGWTEEQMLGKDPALQLAMAGDRAQADEARARLRRGEKLAAVEVDWTRPDGSVRRFSVRGTHGQWDGEPAMIAMVEDVTERAQSEAMIRGYVAQLESAMRGTLQAVARMVDLRDPYTAGHERRVGQIAAAIGRELGWDQAHCRGIELVGLVHDIGKIAVPAEILSKPSRLSATEFAMIKGHAQAGADILADIQFDMPVAEIVRQHHERMDGSGYPRGLRGAEILLEARVLAVADVLESMASHRPYRPALGIEMALAELTSKRGTAFDPAVVDATVRLVREKGYTLP